MNKCNMDCFNCTYDDCILDADDICLEETKEIDMELDFLDEIDHDTKKKRREYYKQNRDYYLKYHKQYYKQNRDYFLKYRKQYYKKNRYQINKRARINSLRLKISRYDLWMDKYKKFLEVRN